VERIHRTIPADSNGNPEIETGQQKTAEARAELSHGALGAILVAGVAVSILFIGWVLFYVLLFMRRGYVG
jgi:hypothetical protein